MSRGLELLLAEKSEEVSLVGSITAAINDIHDAKNLANSGLSAHEVLEKVYDKLDAIVDRFRKALESAKNGNSE